MIHARSLGALLRLRALDRPGALAYAFLEDGATESDRLTYAQLDARASALAVHLAGLGARGERALLLFPPGLDFVSAFFGCLYAGAIAVPAALPRLGGDARGLERLRGIARDAGVRFVLTTQATLELARPLLPGAPELHGARWIGVGAIRDEHARWEPLREGGLAFLQYTSGSTRAPKGVRVTQGNLLHNLLYQHDLGGHDDASVGVSWLPAYHDMGLIEGILLPLFGAFPTYLMPPHAFLQQPARWLQAISRYRATHSGGPSFAYDLCARKVVGAERDALDLSSWRVAYNGAEPIRRETLERFHQAFSPRGFRGRSMCAVYGLAESTLLVTSRRPGTEPRFFSGRVGVGTASHGMEVRIVAPASREEQSPGVEGEIWVRGPSVADGYWNHSDETAATFGARLANGDGPFLRTGDLGLAHGGELFITGRLKDLIILRGRNHHPQDLEQTVETAHPALRPGCVAAFATHGEGEEQLAILAEVDPSRLEGTLQALAGQVRGALTAEHGVAPRTICFIPPRTIFKTSSGKLQRSACREALERGQFEVLYRWEAPSEEELTRWLCGLAGEVDPRQSIAHLGLDSLGLVTLREALSRRLGREIPMSALSESQDLESLARFALEAQGPGVSRQAGLARMREDAVLPQEIQPAATAADPGAPVLLTGATGFLGTHLLHELLLAGREVVCLVRARSAAEGLERIRLGLATYGLEEDAGDQRIHAVAADLTLPRLGLPAAGWDELARWTGAIFHSAASVNWVFPYGALRDSNVLGTRALLRLACAVRAKPFHFVSSQLVCEHATAEPREISETDDLLGELHRLHLGYAQSKCVAERLVFTAGERGLPIRVYRPPFLLGSARSGRCSRSDLLARMISGCVQLGCAPDLDWALDCCPVDWLSALIVHGERHVPRELVTLHPPLPAPRHWRECVLWMNLFGYRVELVPRDTWLRELERRAGGPEHPLFCLRPFFLEQVEGMTRPERYETPRRNRVSSRATRAALAGWGVECPRLGAALLDRYFQSWIAQGCLPPVARRARPARDDVATSMDDLVLRALRERSGKEALSVERLGRCGEHSLTSELASWRYGAGIGLFRYRVRQGGCERSLVVKAKASDTEVIDVAASVARQCGGRLGDLVERHAPLLGFSGCHLRELEIYGQRDPRFTAHAPQALFRLRDDARGAWLLGLEDLAGRASFASEDVSGWGRAERDAALRGLAALHAIGYPHGARGWPRVTLPPAVTARRMAEAEALWSALEENARPFFAEHGGDRLPRLHRSLIASVDRWWRPLEALPRTLIHNDFNPRNLALRPAGDGLQLCAYDWELAAEGIPQRDLAELLVFTLDPDAPAAEIERSIDLHRRELERASGHLIDPRGWRVGLAAALGDLLVNRLSLYAVIHRFQRLAFLPRVVRTWTRLVARYPVTAWVGGARYHGPSPEALAAS